MLTRSWRASRKEKLKTWTGDIPPLGGGLEQHATASLAGKQLYEQLSVTNQVNELNMWNKN
jgi:hypothetical protein